MKNHTLFTILDDTKLDEFIVTLKSFQEIIDTDRLKQILDSITYPYTIALEKIYNDKTYRDSYYHHFASKYSFYSKNSKRLAIFSSDTIELEDFFCEEGHKKLQEYFVGTIVLKPIYPGTIGKTLLSPLGINISNACIRTTKFDSVFLGVELSVNSFPFSSQDSETMTCAETAIWSLMKYYGTRYPVYKVALPSDIHKSTDGNSFERVLPSIGLAYSQSSGALKSFGFYPRFYASEVQNTENSKVLNRILTYYISSGIPTLCGINLVNTNTISGHLVVCVGHENTMDFTGVPIHQDNSQSISFIDFADTIRKFSFMDDNQVPFALQSYDSFEYYTSNGFDSTNIKYLIIPLYKRIFLTAENASTYFYNIFKQDGIGLGKVNYQTQEPFVIKIFLASSRKYKHFRSTRYSHIDVAKTYLDIPFPKFIWVAEIGTKDTIGNNKIIGEVILDATASGNNVNESIIAIHYPGIIAHRNPEENFNDIFRNSQSFSPVDIEYDSFDLNLTCIE